MVSLKNKYLINKTINLKIHLIEVEWDNQTETTCLLDKVLILVLKEWEALQTICHLEICHKIW